MRNSEHIMFIQVFWFIYSPTNLQGYYRYFIHNTQFPTAHSCSNQMVFCFFHGSFFTAAFPHPTAHSSFSKSHSSTKHTPNHLEAKAPKVTNAKHTISTKLKCLRFAVLSSALKLSLSQTQLKDITRITQSLKERLGRAQQGYQAFLGQPASNRKIPGIAAHQGGGSRV
jgi:hypothetical protein